MPSPSATITDTGSATKQAERERRALMHDPFFGDFGGSGSSDRILSDKIVTARKGGECQDCGEEIHPGTRIRTRSEVYDNELMSFRWCHICTAFMGFKFPWLGEKGLERRIARMLARRASS